MRAVSPGAFQVQREMPGSLLASLVFILIEDDVDQTAGSVAKLIQLSGSKMCAEGAGGVAKAGLPQHRQVEQSFDQDHRRAWLTDSQANRPPLERGSKRWGKAAPILRP